MTVRKGFSLFILLVILASSAVLYSSFDRTSLLLLLKANPMKLSLAFGLVVLVWLLDALKMKMLLQAAGERITLIFSLQLTWVNYFGCAITPLQGGGGPFQMYMMYQKGISVGKSFAVTLVKTLFTMFILGLAVPFAFLFPAGDLPHTGWGMRSFLIYVVLFIIAIWCVVVLSLVRPNLVKRFACGLVQRLERLGFMKKERRAALFRTLIREIDAYNQNIRLFITSGAPFFSLALLLASLQMLAQLSVMPCLIWAMGFPVPYIQSVLLQALLIFLLYFVPTPGGSGVAEGGAAAVFSLFVPWELAGVLAVGWRLLLEYTGVALGAFVAIRALGWNITEKMKKAECEVGKENECDECLPK